MGIVNRPHIYSFYGFSQDEYNTFIGTYDADWDTFTHLCETYHVQFSIARLWVAEEEVVYMNIEGITYIERGSFALRFFGVVTRCCVCSRVVWQHWYHLCCCSRCNNIYNYYKGKSKRNIERNMWLIHPQSLLTFGEVLYKRRMQIKRKLEDFESIVGETVHYLRLVEGGLVAPPVDDETLRLYAKWLDIDTTSEAYERFADLAQHDAKSIMPKVISVDVVVKKAGTGFVAELATRYEKRLRCYGATKGLAVYNLGELLKVDVSGRLRQGKAVFYNPKGFKELKVNISEGWKF